VQIPLGQAATQLGAGRVGASSQHPPLHAVNPVPHRVEHVLLLGSQARSTGQSVATAQPHAPFTHPLPFTLPVQSVQLAPQPWVTVSATHAPPTQHVPVPHVPSPATPHAVVQTPPALHVGVVPEQAPHAPPPFPHSALFVPATQVAVGMPTPGWQHPPLHAE
jgi:hypothetical protein